MANTSYLQLYLDTDYILPVAVGADGNLVKYQSQGESRLWLYFSKAAGRDVYETGSAQKANFEAKMKDYFGSFWTHLEEGDNVGTEPFTYIDLLDVAGIYPALHAWFKALLMTDTPDVVLNFATTIGIKARRVFVDYLIRKGLHIRSYSVEINDLVAEKVVYDNRFTMKRVFGDQLLVLQSTGDKILLSALTWCGDMFMQGDKPAEIDKLGDDFKKVALARMVVEKAERHYNMLLPGEHEAEVAYQAQFAEKWLKNRDGDTIWADGFHYSKNPGKIYPPEQVSAEQLELLVKANSRDTTNKISKYYGESIVNNHLHTIFLGDVFKDEKFLGDCVDVTSSQGKFTFFNDNALQEAMGRYYYSHGQETEPVEELENRYLTLEGERERIRKYVKNAETLGTLRTAIDNSRQAVSTAIATLKQRTGKLQESWEACMKKSQFDEAEKCLNGMATDDALTAALGDLYDTQRKVEGQASLLTDLKRLNEVHVKEIVAAIEQGYEQLGTLKTDADGLQNLPAELRQRTQHYRDVYPVYLEKKRSLDNELSLDGKRDILKVIAADNLTMEPPPPIDVKTVTAELTCEVLVKKSGLFGMKKERSLHVTLQVQKNEELQFDSVLMISGNKQNKIDRRAWCADLSKGDSHWEKTLSESELPKPVNGELVVQLLPSEDNSHLSSRIYCPSQRVNF